MSDKAVVFDEDNPEWTEADFAAAQGPEALPARLLAAFPNTKPRGGRPAGSDKQLVSIKATLAVPIAWQWRQRLRKRKITRPNNYLRRGGSR